MVRGEPNGFMGDSLENEWANGCVGEGKDFSLVIFHWSSVIARSMAPSMTNDKSPMT
jgi:hypothetical protein